MVIRMTDITTIDKNLAACGQLAYRVPDACTALGIGRTSLYELVKAGKIRLVKIAGRTLVPRYELDRLLSESMHEAA